MCGVERRRCPTCKTASFALLNRDYSEFGHERGNKSPKKLPPVTTVINEVQTAGFKSGCYIRHSLCRQIHPQVTTKFIPSDAISWSKVKQYSSHC